MSALLSWASRHLAAEHGGLVVDPEETEVALAVYGHALDEQLAGSRGLRQLFPNLDESGGSENG